MSVDPDYLQIYEGRTDHPVSEAEKALVNEKSLIVRIGKGLHDDPTLESTEFIGLLKLSPRGAATWLDTFDKLARTVHPHQPFKGATEFRKAYLTHFLQYLIDLGIAVAVSRVSGGWMEFDTPQDYERLMKRFSKVLINE